MSNLHDKFKDKLYELIYNNNVILVDQYGNEHKVFDNQNGFIFKEVPYFF